MGYVAVPSVGWSTSQKKPRCRYCGESRRSAAPLTGTSGTPSRCARSAAVSLANPTTQSANPRWNVATFSGATILGDGGVALILDVPHLVAAGQRQDAQMRAAS